MNKKPEKDSSESCANPSAKPAAVAAVQERRAAAQPRKLKNRSPKKPKKPPNRPRNSNRMNTNAKYREFAVMAMIPGIVGALIVASWALAHWNIGPLFVNEGLAVRAALCGGGQTVPGAVHEHAL